MPTSVLQVLLCGSEVAVERGRSTGPLLHAQLNTVSRDRFTAHYRFNQLLLHKIASAAHIRFCWISSSFFFFSFFSFFFL
jgi:hypothetical protein